MKTKNYTIETLQPAITEKVSTVEIDQFTATAIRQMTHGLEELFGKDFSFMVMGRGKIVACNNAKYGIIRPNV